MAMFEAEERLPKRAYREISEEVIELYEEKLVGRQLLVEEGVGQEKEEYSYPKVTQDMINAEIVGKGGDIPREGMLAEDQIVTAIRKIALGYEIPRVDYLKENWVNRSVRRAAYKVAHKEDDTIINGDSTYGILGIDDVVAETITDTSDWSDRTSDGGEPSADIIDARQELLDQSDNQFGEDPGDLVLLLNPQNEAELWNKFEDEDNTRPIEFIENYVGTIMTSPMVTENDGYLFETGADIAKLIIAEDVTTERGVYDIDNQKFKGNIFLRTVPVFLQHGETEGESTAFVKITNLNS